MPSVADYDIVGDNPITLSATGTDTDVLELQTPNMAVGIRSILSFMLDPGANGITYRLAILNSTGTHPIGTFTAGPAVGHVRQEVINEDVFVPSATGNDLRIEVLNGSGSFGDIVLWFQTNV